MKHSELIPLKTAIASVLTGDIAVPLRVKLLRLRDAITAAQEPFTKSLNDMLAKHDAVLAQIDADTQVKMQAVMSEAEQDKAAAQAALAEWRSTAEAAEVELPRTDLSLADFNDLPAALMKDAEPLLLTIAETSTPDQP